MSKSTAVIAIGGNSLIKDKTHRAVPDQYEAILETGQHIVKLIEHGLNVVITHGNGPQVGFILLRSEIAKTQLHTVPVDSAGADTQGSIGYQIQNAIENILVSKGISDKKVVTIITRVVVDKQDPSFQSPSKPIGPFLSQEEAEEKQKIYGWDIVEDAGRGFRRVVPSPIPREIIELAAIKNAIDAGFIVVAVGGGGIPVIRDEKQQIKGVAAVIDKDRASSLLAQNLKAEFLIISTAIDKVYLNFGTENQQGLSEITVKQAKEYAAAGHFKPGSMLPKIESAIEFIENGGKTVIITTPELIEEAYLGKAGTKIIP